MWIAFSKLKIEQGCSQGDPIAQFLTILIEDNKELKYINGREQQYKFYNLLMIPQDCYCTLVKCKDCQNLFLKFHQKLELKLSSKNWKNICLSRFENIEDNNLKWFLEQHSAVTFYYNKYSNYHKHRHYFSYHHGNEGFSSIKYNLFSGKAFYLLLAQKIVPFQLWKNSCLT